MQIEIERLVDMIIDYKVFNKKLKDKMHGTKCSSEALNTRTLQGSTGTAKVSNRKRSVDKNEEGQCKKFCL